MADPKALADISMVKLSHRPAFQPAAAVQAAISRQLTPTGLLEVITSVDLVASVGCLAQEPDYFQGQLPGGSLVMQHLSLLVRLSLNG
jgi:hypothetical protein